MIRSALALVFWLSVLAALAVNSPVPLGVAILLAVWFPRR